MLNKQPVKAITGVKNLIAIASGKGGVGKSTVASNLALALLAEKRRVGILDADIYGPSIPTILGDGDLPAQVDGGKVQPALRHELQAMSIGWLVGDKSPLIWRGPMAVRALQQLLYDTGWADLDDLVIDLPPGTGDIHLTMAQKTPITGAIIVTTPQDVALADARRAIEMFFKVRVPVIGIVENMAGHVCSKCSHHDSVFGDGGGSAIACEYEIPLLGSIPLVNTVCADTDRGMPTVAADPDGNIAVIYRTIAKKVIVHLASLKVTDFPEIIIKND